MAQTTSTLTQLIEALNRCVEPTYHTSLMSDALQRAGLAEIPVDGSAFREFASGALKQSTEAMLGDAVATDLTWTLMRMTSVRAPSSRSPRSSRRPSPSTVDYTDDVFKHRLDVVLIDPTEDFFDELRLHLEARDYRVARMAPLEALDGMTKDAPPHLVLTNIGLDEGIRVAEHLHKKLGSEGPKLIVLSESDAQTVSPVVARILPRATLAPIVTSIVELVGPRT